MRSLQNRQYAVANHTFWQKIFTFLICVFGFWFFIFGFGYAQDEGAVEEQLQRLEAEYFEIRFDRESDKYDAYDIRDYLREARRRIGQDFDYFPEVIIDVILYPEEEFKKIRQVPEWVAGLYDGRIRLPIRNRFYSKDEFKRILWHEYTHALIRDLSGGNCPLWLNEGLARYEEYKDAPPSHLWFLIEAAQKDSLIPIKDLSDPKLFSNSPNQVALFYEQSYSMVSFIIRRWGWWNLSKILSGLKETSPFEEVFEVQLGITTQDFFRKWKNNTYRNFEK